MKSARDVSFSVQAAKALSTMDERSKEHFKEACRELSVDPGMGKNLKGEFEGLRSYRAGSFRIVYRSTGGRLEVISLDQPTGQFR